MFKLAFGADACRLADSFRQLPGMPSAATARSASSPPSSSPIAISGSRFSAYAAGQGIFDDGHRGGAPGRRRDGAPALDQCLFDNGYDLSNRRAHRSPSSPLISVAASPPTRACTRAPVVIARTSTISSARGAS